MTKLTMSPAKYNYISENIDFLYGLLDEQIKDNNFTGLNIKEMIIFLTTFPMQEDTDDLLIYKEQENFKEELELLRQNMEVKELRREDKVANFFERLMGAIDFNDEDQVRRIPVLLEYIRYHKEIEKPAEEGDVWKKTKKEYRTMH